MLSSAGTHCVHWMGTVNICMTVCDFDRTNIQSEQKENTILKPNEWMLFTLKLKYQNQWLYMPWHVACHSIYTLRRLCDRLQLTVNTMLRIKPAKKKMKEKKSKEKYFHRYINRWHRIKIMIIDRAEWVFFLSKILNVAQFRDRRYTRSKYRLGARNRWERFTKLDAINGIEKLTSRRKYSICQKNRTKSNQLKKIYSKSVISIVAFLFKWHQQPTMSNIRN